MVLTDARSMGRWAPDQPIASSPAGTPAARPRRSSRRAPAPGTRALRTSAAYAAHAGDHLRPGARRSAWRSAARARRRCPSRSWNTSTWPSVAGPAPIPITGISSRAISVSATAAGIASNTIEKHPACLQRERVAGDRHGPLGGAALRAVAAQRGGGLRGEPDVAHHRDAGVDDRARALRRWSPPRSSLTASQPASLMNRCAVAIACSSEPS